ncbi:MAG: hypothetical protein WDN31_18125 [Hyphomicrobium sp.]
MGKMEDKMLKKILPIAIVAALAATAATSAQAQGSPLTGRWILGDGAGVLVIRGASWFHPKNGAGRITPGKGAADYEVFYTEHQGVRCAYHVNTVAGGEILVLEAADDTQSPDFCPSGKLSG